MKGTKKAILTKACPKCKGDLFLDHDHYGWYWECIQCGYLLDLEEGAKEKKDEATLELAAV